MNSNVTTPYNYQNAINRNIGLCSELEQEILKTSTVGIAGVGAVGGNYLITLARMGIGHFKIADLDIFEEANLQRQAGAFITSLNKPKVDVMAEMALDINPNIKVQVFPQGITEETIDEFLSGLDVVLDGIDAFQIGPRRLLYQKAREKGIFVMISAPKAYGATLQIFDPNGMSFDEYFNISDSMTRAEQIAAFLLGLAPFKKLKYGIDDKKINFEKEKAPALACTVALSTGVITSAILKLLLNREKPKCIPHAFYVDSYHWSFLHTRGKPIRYRWLQKLIFKICLNRYPSLKKLHLQELNKIKS